MLGHQGGILSSKTHTTVSPLASNAQLQCDGMVWTAQMELNYQSRLCELKSNSVVQPVASNYTDRLYVKDSFLKLIGDVAGSNLTHVTYNVEDTHKPHLYKTLTVDEILKSDLIGHHLLIDVPLKNLKPCVAKLKFAARKNGGKSTSAIFLIPRNKFFSKISEGMKYLGQYTASQVYLPDINPKIQRPAIVEAFLCDNFCVPPPPPFCNMAGLNIGILTMQFDGMINHAGRAPNIPINVFLDSGATHNFLPLSIATKLGIPVLPSSFNSTGLGNGKDCTVLGECSLSLEIQGVRDTLKCLILKDFMQGIDLVLGNSWHKSNEAITN